MVSGKSCASEQHGPWMIIPPVCHALEDRNVLGSEMQITKSNRLHFMHPHTVRTTTQYTNARRENERMTLLSMIAD